MIGIPDWLINPSMANLIKRQADESKKRRMAAAVPWTPDIKLADELNIKAETYDVGFDPFPEAKPVKYDGWRKQIRTHPDVLHSPDDSFVYVKQLIPAGHRLQLYGRKDATVLFDGPVAIPALFEPAQNIHQPWMSLTPAEIISLRGGTRRAKGHVIVAGLGLGYQLAQVAKRKQVKQITLVERSQELVDWILPRLKLGRKIEVVVGNAYEVIPKMTADVCLLDIFPGYGWNEADQITHHSPGIKSFWIWGSGRSGKNSLWD